MPQKTFPRPAHPLVAQNVFRARTYAFHEISSFPRARSLLPEPVLPQQPGWVEVYWRAWEIAWSNLRRPRPNSGFVANFIDTAFNNNTFMWDSCFMVQFGLYGRRAFDFMGTLDNFYAKQHDDGFICREISTESGEDFFFPFDPDSTGPNIFAWAEWNYYRQTGDQSRLALVLPPLIAYHHWLRAHRTWPSRLYWATGLSSGMDNQPRIPDSDRYHQHWTWMDANLQALINCRILSRIAQTVEKEELVADLAEERAFLLRQINTRFWNPETNFFHDLSPAGEFSMVKSVAAYWALLDKEIVPTDRLDAFLAPLRDVEMFNRPHRVPSISADSPGYNGETGNYWCGGVWPPTNYMVLQGLNRAGKSRLAHKIARNHIEQMYAVFRQTDILWENYAPESPAPGRPAKPNFVGWSGLGPIAMLFENIIGLRTDWPQRRLTWNRYLVGPEPAGVRNYPLGADGRLDMLADREKVEIETNQAFTLTIHDESGSLQTAVPVGKTTLKL
jgi:glycogen debranching enzyme